MRFTWAVSNFSFIFILFWSPSAPAALDPSTLPKVGYHPGGIAYWDTPYFCNAVYFGGWIEYAPNEWGNSVVLEGDPQFDPGGYPRYLDPGLFLRATLFGLHVDPGDSRPPTWPRRSGLAEGYVVLTWSGDADVRLHGGAFVPADSNGGETGRIANGRRAYRFSGGSHTEWLEVHEIDPSNPITDLKVWLPNPSDPMNSALEGELFHPTFLARLSEADWGFIRFMNFLSTNANPQQDWSDRRLPAHCQMNGTLNTRPPATGSPGYRDTGMAFEFMAELCNASGKDLWVCVPHLATDDFVTNLAQLIRYGSDGTDPYTSDVPNPVHPPLQPQHRVFVEYSNEIWSSGYSFPQGNWAEEQASAAGITKGQFNARRFCEIWSIFQEVFGGTDRLVNVAALFTANQTYNQEFLSEIAAYGPSTIPPVTPDAVAVTTYFGNGIQDYIFQRAQEEAGGPTQWFLTDQTFDAGGGNPHSVSLPPEDPYWIGPDFEQNQEEAFDEWMRRLLSGDAQEGAGPDAVGVGGGFDSSLRDLIETTLGYPVPIIAYEGGPSLYTDNYDWGDSRDDGITLFLEEMNRHPRITEVYETHLNFALSKGLRSHVAFTDCGPWGKYGQWGHLEYLEQPNNEALKHQFILDWMTEASGLRPIDDPMGATPEFLTSHALPIGVVGQPYSATLEVGGGNSPLRVDLIGDTLVQGLSYLPPSPVANAGTVQGLPVGEGRSFLYLRVADADGDANWRTFTLRTVGGPGTLVESDLRGNDVGLSLPWRPAYVLDPKALYSGWVVGLGAFGRPGADALVWSINMPPNEPDSTLALALAEEEYLSMTIQPEPGSTFHLRNGEVRFTLRRIDYHAPRRYSLFSSVEGFSESSALLTTPYDNSTDDQQYSFNLPDDPSYEELDSPIEFRLYGFGGQYGGHRTSLVDFKLKENIADIPDPTSTVSNWRMY